MKSTGVAVTPSESRHFKSLAKHVETYAKIIEQDMRSCKEADWTDLDRCYIQGKLADLEANMQAMKRVLDDMLPEMWEDL